MLDLQPELFGSFVRRIAVASLSERPGEVSKKMVLTYLKQSKIEQLSSEEKLTLQYLTSWARDGTFEIIQDDDGWVSETQIVRYVTWLRDISDESRLDNLLVTFSLN